MLKQEFDRLVERAIEEIPAEFQPYLKDVAFVIQDGLSDAQRQQFGFSDDEPDPLGFYDGIPIGERSTFDDAIPHRDTIYVLRQPLLELCQNEPDRLEEEIRVTIIHEIAHHFGMDDDEVDRLGYG